jgi:hypothetical protein
MAAYRRIVPFLNLGLAAQLAGTPQPETVCVDARPEGALGAG